MMILTHFLNTLSVSDRGLYGTVLVLTLFTAIGLTWRRSKNWRAM